MEIVLNKISKFSIVWYNAKGELKELLTDCEDLALKTKYKRNGEVYFRPKYEAEKRLQMFYKYLFDNGKLKQEDISYNLVSFK
jgi:hypothetical protein